MSVKQRYRLAKKLARCLAAGGMLVACAPVDDASEPTTPEERIARDLDRLDDLDVLAVAGMIDDTPETAEQQATRLEAFTDVAERAVVDIDAGDIDDQWETEDGPTLCVRGDGTTFCLTRELHADNLRRVNALEIVAVTDIIRGDAENTGFCYSSWDPVTETECVRAIKLRAIADLADTELGE